MKKRNAGRKKNLFLQIESSLKANEHRVWFHCASTRSLSRKAVMEAYRKKFPQHKIVLTFFPFGFELRKNPGAVTFLFTA
jgi:3-deoxy-D-manno-octulosonic-acid transferase